MKVKKICEQCGREYSIEFKRRTQRFCNRKCFLINKQKKNISKKCQYCGKPFWVSPSKEKYHFPKFCSARCLYKSGHGKRENHWHWKGITAIRKCLVCGNDFKPKTYGKELATKHCSIKCARNSPDYIKRMSGKNNHFWKSGKHKIWWNEDEFIYKFFKGTLFGKGFKATNELDKEIIRTRVRLFKIQRKEVRTDETNRI